MALQMIIRKFRVVTLLAVIVAALLGQNRALAAQLQLTWVDNSNNETGFKIERSTVTTGPFSQIATVGANVTSYIDANLANGTTYCYRVRAYNGAGDSSYVEACKATAQVYTLSLGRAGTGSGMLASTPAGINCGITCTGSFTAGSTVNLTATPTAGSTFAGWSGNADCSDGSVTMSGAKSCTATFNTVAVISQQPLLPSAGMLLNDPTKYADVNGDGRLDILYFDTKGTRGVWVSLAADTGFLAPELWLQHGESTPDQIQYADVNGDGKDDALYFDTLRSRGVWVSVSTGTGFMPPEMWVQHGESAPNQIKYADVNGDGRDDALYYDVLRSRGIWVSLSSATGFRSAQMWLQLSDAAADQVQYMDVNGDGKADVIYDDSTRSGNVWVSLSTGNGFSSAFVWPTH